jgi:hypothetical protein
VLTWCPVDSEDAHNAVILLQGVIKGSYARDEGRKTERYKDHMREMKGERQRGIGTICER